MKLAPKTPLGTRRIVSRFAFFPVELPDGSRIWLEFYDQEQIYVAYVYWPTTKNYKPRSFGWEPVKGRDFKEPYWVAYSSVM